MRPKVIDIGNAGRAPTHLVNCIYRALEDVFCPLSGVMAGGPFRIGQVEALSDSKCPGWGVNLASKQNLVSNQLS